MIHGRSVAPIEDDGFVGEMENAHNLQECRDRVIPDKQQSICKGQTGCFFVSL
jgi:hypothetical protein